MKSKVITIIVAIILLGIGVWGGYLLMEKQQLDVIVTNRENSDEIASEKTDKKSENKDIYYILC